MKLSNIKAIAIKNLHQMKRDPRMIALSVIAPILVTALFGSAFGGELTNLDVYIVIDDDNFDNIIGDEVIEKMSTNPKFYFNKSASNIAKARESVDNNYTQAAIIIPNTFTQDLLLSSGAEVELYVNYDNLNTSNYIVSAFQASFNTIMQSYFGDSQVNIRIVAINRGTVGILPQKINLTLYNTDMGWSTLHDELAEEVYDILKDEDTLNLHKVDSFKKHENKVKKGEARAIIKFSDDFTYNVLINKVIKVKVRLDGAEPQASAAIMGTLSEALSESFEDTFDKVVFDVDDEYYNNPDTKNEAVESITYFTPAIIGFIVFFFAFLLTMLAFLRERKQGTMERLLTSPVNRSEIILGYVLSSSVLSLIQATVTILVAGLIFNAQIEFTILNLLQAYIIIYILLLTALGLGIFLSTLAKTEFQIIQFIPLIIIPFMLLSGVWAPVEALPEWLHPLSAIIPLTYANRAMRNILTRGQMIFPDLILELSVLLGGACLMIILGVIALNRKLQ
ncbi:MAG: ABC transporter permease subunit [Candidatus Lokiarchaeota archaeon]|nr:ABC transporter permease subunit [Candidatus Lokiarchaeota archaeon]